MLFSKDLDNPYSGNVDKIIPHIKTHIEYHALVQSHPIVVIDCYSSSKSKSARAQRAEQSIIAYNYLRSEYPAIPYRRIDLSEFPKSSSLGLKVRGKAAYIIVHQGEPVHPDEDSLLVRPGQTIWGTRPVSPITGAKILGSDACSMTSEDVVVAQAISLFYEEQREGGYVEREIAALKAEEDTWSHKEKYKDSRSIRSGTSGMRTPEKRSFHSFFRPRTRREESEKESMISEKQGRDAVCPWEGL